ncbi:MAG: Protein-tyrosine-phosphatase [Cenarchaeum symbiont of Oopsacas minuta]|nr:Protein-tyrosine-phosphatase [Cenarchaeum symbiont of Oopsacas minuta]
MSKVGDIYRNLHGRITKKPTNFSWIIEDKLAGTGRPMTRDEFDWLVEQGIDSVITMTEEPLEKSWTDKIDWLHLPTPDLEPPSSESIDKAMDFIHKRISSESRNSLAVHCQAGLGRAGSILACYMIRYKGYTAKKAIEYIRKERPGSIQSESQENALFMYEKRVRAD